MNIKESSEYLGITEASLYQQIHRGTGYGPCFKKNKSGMWQATKKAINARQKFLAKQKPMKIVKVYLPADVYDRIQKASKDGVSAYCRKVICAD